MSTTPSASTIADRYLQAATYVQLTREEFEHWLNTDAGYRGKWNVKPGTVGVYIAHLSDTVGIAINSTVSGRDMAVRDVGQASMSVKLVSRTTGRTINKKAQGQSHFNRTSGWRKTWLKGLERMKAAYLKSKDFYDEIAGIEDRDAYKAKYTGLIEAQGNWGDNDFLVSLHQRLSRNGVLSKKQREALERQSSRRTQPSPSREPSGPRALDAREQEYLLDLRALWTLLRPGRDRDFIKDLGARVAQGRGWSGKQDQWVSSLLDRFNRSQMNQARSRVQKMKGRRASALPF